MDGQRVGYVRVSRLDQQNPDRPLETVSMARTFTDKASQVLTPVGRSWGAIQPTGLQGLSGDLDGTGSDARCDRFKDFCVAVKTGEAPAQFVQSARFRAVHQP